MYLQTVNPRPTAISTQLCSSAADPRVHRHRSLPSITSLMAAVRLNLITDEKGAQSLSLPECTERMRMIVPHYLEQEPENACGTI